MFVFVIYVYMGEGDEAVLIGTRTVMRVNLMRGRCCIFLVSGKKI